MTKLTISTREGVNSITTNKLKGELKAIILQTKEQKRMTKLRLTIDSELGYRLFDYPDISETMYIPLTIRNINPKAQQEPQSTSFYLDEKLVFTLSGPPNQELDIVLRFS